MKHSSAQRHRWIAAAMMLLLVLPTSPSTAFPQRAAAARPLPSSAWGWPLAGTPAVIKRFDPPAKPWLAGHRGVDLSAAQGSLVLAPVAGVVSFAGIVAGRPVLTLTTATGLKLSFEPVAALLHAGEPVRRAQVLGTLAGPTHCGAPPTGGSCLHWGVRREQRYLNPLQFLLDLRPSVLLPLRSGP